MDNSEANILLHAFAYDLKADANIASMSLKKGLYNCEH